MHARTVLVVCDPFALALHLATQLPKADLMHRENFSSYKFLLNSFMKAKVHKSFIATAVVTCSAFLTPQAEAMAVAVAVAVAELYATPVVADTVTQINASTWKYDFTLTNMATLVGSTCSDCVRLTNYLVPYFGDAAIFVSQVPTGWAWRIDGDDRFNLGHGAQTLHWYSTSLSTGIAGGKANVSGDTLGGFSYISSFGPIKAPFLGGFSAQPWFWVQGDPALPGSPDTQAAGLNQTFATSNVPEPTTFALLAAGVMLLGVKGHRSRQSGRRV